MACFDVFFILSYVINTGYESMACRDGYIYEVQRITYPLLNIGISGSIYSTIAISMERYLRLCHPHLKYTRTSWVYIPPVVAITLGYSLPRFFEYEYYIENGTLFSEIRPWATSNTYENRYHYWAEFLVEDIIPILSVLVLNGAIVNMMYCRRKDNNDVAARNRKNRATTTKI